MYEKNIPNLFSVYVYRISFFGVKIDILKGKYKTGVKCLGVIINSYR